MSKTIAELQAELDHLEGKRPQPAAQTKPATFAFEQVLKDEWKFGECKGKGDYQSWRETEGEKLRLEHDAILLDGIDHLEGKCADADEGSKAIIEILIDMTKAELSYVCKYYVIDELSGFYQTLQKKQST